MPMICLLYFYKDNMENFSTSPTGESSSLLISGEDIISVLQPPVNVTRDRILLFVKVVIAVASCLSNLFTFTVLVYGKLYRKNMYMVALLMTTVDLVLSGVHLPIAIVVSEIGTAVNGTNLCVINALLWGCYLDLTILCQVNNQVLL